MLILSGLTEVLINGFETVQYHFSIGVRFFSSYFAEGKFEYKDIPIQNFSISQCYYGELTHKDNIMEMWCETQYWMLVVWKRTIFRHNIKL